MTAAALDLVGPALPGLTAYAELLAGPGVERGLLGPREVPRLWDRHLLNCAVVAELVPTESRVADVGSGAGLPGLVLALVRPDLDVTLVEPLLRRATFLREAVDVLGTSNVRVVRSRAEDLTSDRGSMDVVVARAVAPLDRLAGWCLPLLRGGGLLLALKGATAGDEVRAAGAALTRAGATDVEVVEVGDGVVDPLTTVVRAVRGPVGTRARGRRGPG